MTIFRRILMACLLPLVIIFSTIIFLLDNIVSGKVTAYADQKAKIFAAETSTQADADYKNEQLHQYVVNEVENATKIIIIVSVFGLLVFAAILFFMVRSILRPIKRLTESANMIASGEFDSNLDSIIDVELSEDKKQAKDKDEIHILFEALRSMNRSIGQTKKIEAVSKAKSDFLAKMSHEIRTPMNAITGMTELALREEMTAAAKEHVLTIKQAGANLLSLINDILDFSKIESGKLEITPAPYYLSSLVNDVVSIIRMKVIDSNVRFVVNLDSRIPGVLCGDESRIRQILLNVLSNAVKYTPSGHISFVIAGEVTDSDTAVLTIDVADTGKGIKQEDIKKLFGDFVQVDLAGNKGIEGTGLGLAITKNLVNAMGGEISVASEYGRGSTFTVSLPQKIVSAEPLAVVDKAEEKSVLVYERRKICANSIASTIDNLGVSCTCVQSDEEFREKLREKDYTFIFIDSHIYEKNKKMLSELNTKAQIALLSNFGAAVADKGLCVIAMPCHSISVANIINGVSDSFSYSTSEDAIVRFCAPEARILIVDDINTNLKVAQGLLSPYGMQIDLCKNGDQAVHMVRETRYDLVLMDHMMPGTDGVEAVRLIRASGGDCAKVPIIALTANAVTGMKEMFLANGFNDFLSKPIDMVKLNAVLEKWIPNKKKTAAVKRAAADKEITTDIAIEGVDVKLGIARTGGNAAGYLRSLAIFSKDGREKIGEIKKCFENDDNRLYVTYVHGLKSAAANIGAVRLSEIAEELETAEKRKDRTFVQEHTPNLLAELESLLSRIDEVVSAEKRSGETDIDVKTLRAGLTDLAAAIEELSPGAIKAAIKTLRQFENAAGAAGGAVENILQNVLTGEYEKAVSLIESLLKEVEA